MKNNGIISKDDFEIIDTSICKREFYNKLRNQKIIYAHDTSEHEKKLRYGFNKESEPKVRRSKSFKIEPEKIKDFYLKLGANDNFPVIDGSSDSLNGYSIVGIENYGIVILENFSNPENATYIMPYQQVLFYLNNDKKAELLFQNKGEIRQLDNVKVNNHVAGFGKNVVKSIKSINSKLNNDLQENTQYKQKINNIIDEIKNQYEKNKDR